MALVTKHLHQKAVLWAANGTDPQGETKVDAKTEINVRWQEVQKQGVDEQGQVIAIEAKVAVDQAIPIDSIMWLGESADVATPPVDLYQVKFRHHVPNVRNTETRRVVDLVKYSDTLPTLA